LFSIGGMISSAEEIVSDLPCLKACSYSVPILALEMSERRQFPWDPRDPWEWEWESELDGNGDGNGNDSTGMGIGQFPLKGKKINNTLLSNTNLAALHQE
jgi:hypothetical protein